MQFNILDPSSLHAVSQQSGFSSFGSLFPPTYAAQSFAAYNPYYPDPATQFAIQRNFSQDSHASYSSGDSEFSQSLDDSILPDQYHFIQPAQLVTLQRSSISGYNPPPLVNKTSSDSIASMASVQLVTPTYSTKPLPDVQLPGQSPAHFRMKRMQTPSNQSMQRMPKKSSTQSMHSMFSQYPGGFDDVGIDPLATGLLFNDLPPANVCGPPDISDEFSWAVSSPGTFPSALVSNGQHGTGFASDVAETETDSSSRPSSFSGTLLPSVELMDSNAWISCLANAPSPAPVADQSSQGAPSTFSSQLSQELIPEWLPAQSHPIIPTHSQSHFQPISQGVPMQKSKSSGAAVHDLFAFSPQASRITGSSLSIKHPLTPIDYVPMYYPDLQTPPTSISAIRMKKSRQDLSSIAMGKSMSAQVYPPSYTSDSCLDPISSCSNGLHYASVPMTPSRSASVLQPASIKYGPAPDIADGWTCSNPPKAPKAPRAVAHAPAPALTTTPLSHTFSRMAVDSPLSSKQIASMPSAIAKKTVPKSPKKTLTKKKSLGAFVNFTPQDADINISAVAPSGSNKRKRAASEGAASPKRSKTF